jgi:hypothetical protein
MARSAVLPFGSTRHCRLHTPLESSIPARAFRIDPGRQSQGKVARLSLRRPFAGVRFTAGFALAVDEGREPQPLPSGRLLPHERRRPAELPTALAADEMQQWSAGQP